MPESISEPLRNLCLDHRPNSDTFQSHYLARHVQPDVYAIHRQQQPQNELIKQATSHGSSRDTRLPINLPENYRHQLRSEDAIYNHLTARLFSLPRGSETRKQVSKERHARDMKLQRQGLEQYREEWTRQQALADVDRQLLGQKISTPGGRAVLPMTPAQTRMMNALQAPLVHNLEAQFRRRTEAIGAIIAYCDVEEPLKTKVKGNPPPPPEVSLDPLDRARGLRASVFGPVNKVFRCFFCISRALAASPDDFNIPTWAKAYCGHGSLSRHFRTAHLQHLAEEEAMTCPVCVPRVHLGDKKHVQNHAEAVHGIKTGGRKNGGRKNRARK